MLLKWDLSSIAPGSLIQSVSLSLNSLSTTSAGYEIYDLTKNRIEDETTWNEFSTGSSWNQGGASGSQDHGTTVLGTFTAASPGPVASDLNAAGVAVVQSWVNNPSGNYGITVQDYDPANGVRFSSADASSSADRPALMVSYAEPQYVVNHEPRLQLGNAPLVGFSGSSADQVEIMWQTVPAGPGTHDDFQIQYRKVVDSTWTDAGPASKLNTGVEGRINHSVAIQGLAYHTDYRYRVRHRVAGVLIESYEATFHTRLPAGDNSSFSFAAYGDSANNSTIDDFSAV